MGTSALWPPLTPAKGRWELGSSHSPWTVPGGNKGVSGVENPYGIGIPGEAGEVWALGAAQPWGGGVRIHVGVSVKIPGGTGGKAGDGPCSQAAPQGLPSGSAPSVPGGVLLLLTEAPSWSPRDCFGGELPSLTCSITTFCHTGGQAGGSTQKCLLGVTGDSSAVSWGHWRHFGPDLYLLPVKDPRASLELTLSQPLHGP